MEIRCPAEQAAERHQAPGARGDEGGDASDERSRYPLELDRTDDRVEEPAGHTCNGEDREDRPQRCPDGDDGEPRQSGDEKGDEVRRVAPYPVADRGCDGRADGRAATHDGEQQAECLRTGVGLRPRWHQDAAGGSVDEVRECDHDGDPEQHAVTAKVLPALGELTEIGSRVLDLGRVRGPGRARETCRCGGQHHRAQGERDGVDSDRVGCTDHADEHAGCGRSEHRGRALDHRVQSGHTLGGYASGGDQLWDHRALRVVARTTQGTGEGHENK